MTLIKLVLLSWRSTVSSDEELLEVAGEYAMRHGEFGSRTTYRVGGTARVVVEIPSEAVLAELTPALRAASGPLFILGRGSNTLVADSGFDGIVLVLGSGFPAEMTIEAGSPARVTLPAHMSLPVAARQLADQGLVGFEWAVGVPGSVGGATRMNAGGHGSDMAAVVTSSRVWNLATGRVDEWLPHDLGFGYRQSAIGVNDIVLSTCLELQHGDADGAKQRLREIVAWRRAHQPGGSNAGSVFQNPESESAGALIERCGLKGLRRGSAFVSEKHANFIQVDDGGSADDVYSLMLHVAATVKKMTGITLRSEIRTVGKFRELT